MRPVDKRGREETACAASGDRACQRARLANRMIRCFLQAGIGDALHKVSCAADDHIRWLMRAIMRLGFKASLRATHLPLYDLPYDMDRQQRNENRTAGITLFCMHISRAEFEFCRDNKIVIASQLPQQLTFVIRCKSNKRRGEFVTSD